MLAQATSTSYPSQELCVIIHVDCSVQLSFARTWPRPGSPCSSLRVSVTLSDANFRVDAVLATAPLAPTRAVANASGVCKSSDQLVRRGSSQKRGALRAVRGHSPATDARGGLHKHDDCQVLYQFNPMDDSQPYWTGLDSRIKPLRNRIKPYMINAQPDPVLR